MTKTMGTVGRAARARPAILPGSLTLGAGRVARVAAVSALLAAAPATAQVTAIRAGRLVEPEAGTTSHCLKQ